MFGGANNLQDQMLRAYVDKIFDQFDTDKSGTLDQKQMTVFFNQLFKQLNIQRQVNENQSLQAIKSIDKNFDGSVNKQQLFTAFKAMLLKSQMTQSSPAPGGYYGQPPPGYQPPGYGYGGYAPPPGYYPPPPGYGYPSPYYQNPNQMQYSQNQMPQSWGYGGNQMYGSNQNAYGNNPYNANNGNNGNKQGQNNMYHSQGYNPPYLNKQ